MSYFLDTNICISFLKGDSKTLVEKFLSHKPTNLKIPAVVMAELIFGARKSIRPETSTVVTEFLTPFQIIPFDETAAEHYADIRLQLESQGEPIGPNDLLIAAIVRAHDGTLVTRNIGEFNRVSNLQVEVW